MKKLLQLLVVFFFVFSCTKDTFEEPKVDDTNPRIAADQFDNSHLGVYKGMFTTVDGLTRGSVVVTLSPSNEGLAQITLSSGEMIELRSSRIKLTADNTVSNLRFSSEGLSEIETTLEFSVEGDGHNPMITNVDFDNKSSDIFIAKNLSRAPLSPITGTYMRTAGGGSFPLTGRTWNVMSIGEGDNQTFATQIAFGGVVYNTPAANNMQTGCNTAGNYTTCNIAGSATVSGYAVSWGGTHKYSVGTAANEACSGVSGTWTCPTYGNSSGTFISDSDCSGPLVSNDTCATAISVEEGTYTGSTNNATNSDTPNFCTTGLSGTPTGPGVWYTYTPTSDTGVIVDTEGTVGFDTQLRVFSGDCGSLVCIEADDDDGTGLLSTITFYAYSGTTYYFFLGGYNSAIGNYTLNVQEVFIAPPPPNDLCGNATAIACGGSVSGTTNGSNNSGAPTATCNSFSFNTAGGVWHTFTTPTAQIVTMDTAGSDFDTKLAVYSGSCGALTCVTGNDEGTGISPQSLVTFNAAAGATYYVYVTGYGTATGNYVLNAACVTPPPAPANDLCADAISIACGGSAVGTNVNSTATGTPATCTTGLLSPGTLGVWYKFSSPTNQSVTVDTEGSTLSDTQLRVFSGSCGTLTCVGADDDGGTGLLSSLTFGASSGTQYYIFVAGYNNATGSFNINVACAPPIPGGTFTLTPACNDYLVDNGTSTADYANSSNDTYTLDAGAGNKISLLFTVFNLENTWDAMRLYNGQTVGVNEITAVGTRAIYVNASNPDRTGFTNTGTNSRSLQDQTVVSSGRYLTITFKSDGSGQRAGFLAQVNCIPARMADDSHIKTSATFMPAPSASAPKVLDEAMTNKLKVIQEKLEAAERRELESRNTKIFHNEADRIEYNRKHRQ